MFDSIRRSGSRVPAGRPGPPATPGNALPAGEVAAGAVAGGAPARDRAVGADRPLWAIDAAFGPGQPIDAAVGPGEPIDISDIQLSLLSGRGEPGSSMPAAALVAVLAGADPAILPSDADALELAAAWHRVVTWAHGRLYAAVAEFARRPPEPPRPEGSPSPGADHPIPWPLGRVARGFCDDELAVRLGVSRPQAARLIEVGCALAVDLPATRAEVLAGRLDPLKAQAVAEACAPLDPAARAAVEAACLPEAPTQPPSRVRAALARAAIAADPAAAERRCSAARRGRRVTLQPLPDGVAGLWAVLPADTAVAVDAALSAAARAMKAGLPDGDERTLQQLRADALAAPFVDTLDPGKRDGAQPIVVAGGCSAVEDPDALSSCPNTTGRPPRAAVLVTVPVGTLLGTLDEPGHLAGYGWITPETARRVAADATWQRILTDPPSGSVLDLGDRSYTPSAPLARHVKARDGSCRFPSCNWPAHRCDLDHTVPFDEGGPTSAANLGPLCRRHHRYKHGQSDPRRPGSPVVAPTVEQLRPGRFRWTMPTGNVRFEGPRPADPPGHGVPGTPADPERPPDP